MESMNYNVLSYAVYLPITVGLTVWVAQTLVKNGKIFLVEIFGGDKELAGSVNKLLQVGFYLINIGYAVMALTITKELVDLQRMLEALSLKVGAIILILGFMHFFNLFILFQLRKRAQVARKPKISINPFNHE